MAVSLEKLFEVVDLLLQFAASVGVPYEHSVIFKFLKLDTAMDVGALLYSLLLVFKGFVLDKL